MEATINEQLITFEGNTWIQGGVKCSLVNYRKVTDIMLPLELWDILLGSSKLGSVGHFLDEDHWSAQSTGVEWIDEDPRIAAAKLIASLL